MISVVRSMSVVLAARAAAGRFARFGLARLFREVAALFTASDATMGPQAFENHFGGRGNSAGVLSIVDAEPADVLEQALNLGKLLAALDSGGQLGKLQLAPQLEPLNHRLKIHFREMLAEDAAHRGANQLARDSIGALELTFVLEFEFAGDGGKRGINIRDPRDRQLLAVARGALLGIADDALESGDRQALAHAGAAGHPVGPPAP